MVGTVISFVCSFFTGIRSFPRTAAQFDNETTCPTLFRQSRYDMSIDYGCFAVNIGKSGDLSLLRRDPKSKAPLARCISSVFEMIYCSAYPVFRGVILTKVPVLAASGHRRATMIPAPASSPNR
jgi:hypothetical protein